MGILYSFETTRLKGLKKEKTGLEKNLTAFSPELDSTMLSLLANKILKNKEMLKEKAKILEPRVIISEIANSTPDNIKISGLKLNMDKNKTISFSGYVFGKEYTQDSALAAYILNLGASPLFKSVNVKKQEKIELNRKDITKFSASINLKVKQ